MLGSNNFTQTLYVIRIKRSATCTCSKQDSQRVHDVHTKCNSLNVPIVLVLNYTVMLKLESIFIFFLGYNHPNLLKVMSDPENLVRIFSLDSN